MLRRIQNNPLTGNPRIGGACILLSVAAAVAEFNNEKKTKYHRCTVSVEIAPGETVERQAIMYDKVYTKGGFKVGDSLLLTGESTPGTDGPLLVVSNLHAADRATNADFAAAFDQPEPVATTAAAPVAPAGVIRETVGEGV